MPICKRATVDSVRLVCKIKRPQKRRSDEILVNSGIQYLYCWSASRFVSSLLGLGLKGKGDAANGQVKSWKKVGTVCLWTWILAINASGHRCLYSKTARYENISSPASIGRTGDSYK